MNEHKNVVNVYQTEDYIMIRMNKWDLAEVLLKDPINPLKVLHLEKFMDKVVFQLNNYQESNEKELGISCLENLVDKCMLEAAEEYPELVESINWQEGE